MNNSAKCFIAAKYQDWYAEKVLQQLNRGVTAHDVKVENLDPKKASHKSDTNTNTMRKSAAFFCKIYV